MCIVCWIAHGLVETLPATTDQARAFVHGMLWAFSLHWLVVTLVSLLYVVEYGS